MLDIQYIYDITKTTLPMTKDVLHSCLNAAPMCGYVFCKYEDLITNVNKVNKVTEIDVTLNGENIYNLVNDPNSGADAIIKVEGIRKSNDSFTDTILQSNGNETWTDFSTYSEFMRDEILDVKEKIFKKVFWSFDNIQNWFLQGNVKLNTSMMASYAKDWELFKSDVVATKDLSSFINACSDEAREKYTGILIQQTKKLLIKYKKELSDHFEANNKNEVTITLVKPVINRIYVLSSNYARCKKEWPGLDVVSVSQRNFDMMGVFI